MASAIERNPALAGAQLIGLAAPTFLAGAQVALSYLSIPPLLDKPQSFSTPAFAHIYRNGAKMAIPLSAVGLLSSSLAAYLSHGYPSTPFSTALLPQRAAWVCAAIACAAVPVFTQLVMAGDIAPLLERADAFAGATATAGGASKKTKEQQQQKQAAPSADDDAKVREWLMSWRRLNLVRASIMGAAASFAGYAIVTQPY
ncbi:Anthrone oxygenase [Microdochium nivale]|nr:Anthrone oxygenase [Microdochium nivale]